LHSSGLSCAAQPAECIPSNDTSLATTTCRRLTITLDDDLHRALKETAARQGRSIASIIEESLRLRGIQDQESARALVAQARQRAQLDADEAMALAVGETRNTRRR
jgi:plasmid stability protein